MNFDSSPSVFGNPPVPPEGIDDELDDSSNVTDGLEIDHERLVDLTNRLERDIALIEGAMAHLESREFASVNAAIDVLDGNTTA